MCLYAIPIAPGPVSNITATPAPISVELSWGPPDEPNGIIQHYEVRQTDADDNNVSFITNSSSEQTFEVYPLNPDSNYTFSVRAYTSAGPGEWATLDTTTLQVRKLCLHSMGHDCEQGPQFSSNTENGWNCPIFTEIAEFTKVHGILQQLQ